MSKIALVDCDSFFVSCEQAENPALRGRAVCVVSGSNGCVVSNGLYKQYSQKVMACLKNFTPDVEVCSIDEAYLNMHGLDRLYHQDFMQLAKTIRQKVWQNCGIPVSIGVSSSKLLAKLASDKAKNSGGVYIINQTDLSQVLQETQLEDVCGFGRQHTAKMKMSGIFNCSAIWSTK